MKYVYGLSDIRWIRFSSGPSSTLRRWYVKTKELQSLARKRPRIKPAEGIEMADSQQCGVFERNFGFPQGSCDSNPQASNASQRNATQRNVSLCIQCVCGAGMLANFCFPLQLGPRPVQPGVFVDLEKTIAWWW